MSTILLRRRRPSEAERAERRAQERRLMAEAVEQLRSSEGWRRWLHVRRHFHTYSLHNQLLIALQMPEATRVAGFAAWLRLGYAVRKGETGIYIWAPCRPSRKKMREWREGGADPGTEPRVFFRMVAVFDRSQVAPLPDFPGGPVALDPPIAPIDGDGLAVSLRAAPRPRRLDRRLGPDRRGARRRRWLLPARREGDRAAADLDGDLAEPTGEDADPRARPRPGPPRPPRRRSGPDLCRGGGGGRVRLLHRLLGPRVRRGGILGPVCRELVGGRGDRAPRRADRPVGPSARGGHVGRPRIERRWRTPETCRMSPARSRTPRWWATGGRQPRCRAQVVTSRSVRPEPTSRPWAFRRVEVRSIRT